MTFDRRRLLLGTGATAGALMLAAPKAEGQSLSDLIDHHQNGLRQALADRDGGNWILLAMQRDGQGQSAFTFGVPASYGLDEHGGAPETPMERVVRLRGEVIEATKAAYGEEHDWRVLTSESRCCKDTANLFGMFMIVGHRWDLKS